MGHEPVLCHETAGILLAGGPGLYVDATVGAGGHAAALLAAASGVEVLALDRDPSALELAGDRLAEHGDRVRFLRGNFKEMEALISPLAPKGVQGLLFDLGVSSMQLDRSERGFSYRGAGPLDMRMDPSALLTAKDLIDRSDQDSLAAILRELGDVRRPRSLARRLLVSRDEGRMSTTADLRREVGASGSRNMNAELSRVFQALRIAVNGEMEALDAALESLPRLLAPGGTAAVISYHSLEDRRVKRFFARENRDCLCPPQVPVCVCDHKRSLELLTRRPIKPAAEEIAANPRARSARLRAARKVAN